MAVHDFRSQRLFIEAPLHEGAEVACERGQANYLRNVLRLGDGAVIQVIRIESTLTRDGVMEVATDRAHQFRETPGLVQKFYFETGEPNHYGGLYVWESREAMMAFLQSDLAKTMGQAYELTGPPTVELLNVVFQLRE